MKHKHFPWQRLALSVLGIVLILGVWELAVAHLYTLPDHSIVAFSSMTNNVMYVIGSLVVFFVTGHVFYEWKNASINNLADTAEHVEQDVNETQTITQEQIVRPKYYDDDSIP